MNISTAALNIEDIVINYSPAVKNLRKKISNIQERGKKQLTLIEDFHQTIENFADFSDLVSDLPSYKLIKGSEISWMDETNEELIGKGYGVYKDGEIAICIVNFQENFSIPPHIHLEKEIIALSKGLLSIKIYNDKEHIVSNIKPIICTVEETVNPEKSINYSNIKHDIEDGKIIDEYVLEPGDFIIIDPGTCHTITAIKASEFIVISTPQIKQFPAAEIIK